MVLMNGMVSKRRKKMKFLVMGLLSLCLLFAGCDAFDNFGENGGGITPPSSESTENGGSSNENEENGGSSNENGGSSNENQGSNDNNQNDNPFAGGLENGGQFEGK